MTENNSLLGSIGWSVMIPTFNDGAYLQKCIQSVIEASPSQKGLEIVVIDDGSTRGDPRHVVNSFGVGRIKLIRNKNNLGSSPNIGTIGIHVTARFRYN